MALEDTMLKLQASIDKLTAVMSAGNSGTAAATTAAATPGKPGRPPKAAAATADASAITADMVKAAVVKVKDARGKPAAQKIIKDVGKASELATVKPANFKAVIAACEAMLSEEEEAEDEEEAEEEEDSL